jgi:hypothetical protein
MQELKCKNTSQINMNLSSSGELGSSSNFKLGQTGKILEQSL